MPSNLLGGSWLTAVRCQLALDSRFSNLIADMMSGNHGSMTAEGTVYLLHFDRPYSGRMQHYVSFTHDLERGLESHRQGTGSVTTRRASD